MKVKFLGHSAFLIRENGFSIIIDPFLTNNPKFTGTLKEFGKIDYILVTHGHSDHLGDAVELAKLYDSTLIANFEICNYLSQYNIKTHSMHIGGSHEFDFGKLKLTPALHGSSISSGDEVIDGGNPCGFYVDFGKKSIYHAGDTGLTMDMKLLERYNIDLALLPIGGNFTMDVEDALIAIDFIKPKKVIPMHYNTFDLITADVNVMMKKSKDSRVIKLSPMETLEL